MLTRFAVIPCLLALSLPTCKKHETAAKNTADAASPAASASASTGPGSTTIATANTAAPGTAGPKAPTKPAVDQTAEVIIYGYHRFVKQVHSAWTEILPQDFEKQMQELKNRGIPVIPLQDVLAWKRGEKSIPPRSAVITFDDGWKSQYEVAWPIMKKLNYPLTLFIYTEGVRGGKYGGGEAITWEQLAEMRDAGVDIEAHSATHQDLKKPYDKVTKKHLNPQEYDQWLDSEIAAPKQLLEQKLGIKVNCFAVPFGNWNPQVKDKSMKAGYEAMFTVYGQPITFRTPNDSIGRYLIEANKPKVFTDAIAMIATAGGGGGGAPVASIGASNLQTKPAEGETIRTAMPLVSANLSSFGAIDQGSVKMRMSGLGVVPASFDAKTQTVSYQTTQKLHGTVTVIIEATSGGKKIQSQWTFAVDEAAAGAAPAAPAAGASASPAATPKK
ncbi:MAG: polysaccharide deacetylase family protein [Verrucomicrobiota bacterium]|nr:polysaccharide deacetylase family protein [Verrucomicrobiota bacterium]